MNFKNLLYLVMLTLTVSACKTGSPSEGKTPGGFEYIKTGTGSGPAAVENDYVFFTLKIQGSNGKVLTEMNEGPNMPYLQLNDQPIPTVDVKAVSDLLKGSKVGETYSVRIPIDSLPMASPEIASLEYIEYQFTIKNIRNQEQYDAYIAEMQQEMEAKAEAGRVRIPEIEALVKSTILDYKAGKLKLETTASGLKYYILENGTGENAKNGEMVTVSYYGALEDGNRFDDSFSRGQGMPMKLGQGMVIKGWDEGLTYLNKGAKAFLFIPADLGYGEAGSPPIIPENAPLVFYVEIDDIQEN